MGKKAKKNYYAVARGRKPGIYRTWPECEAQVKGVPARYKGFFTLEEAVDFMVKERALEMQSTVSWDTPQPGSSSKASGQKTDDAKGTPSDAAQKTANTPEDNLASNEDFVSLGVVWDTTPSTKANDTPLYLKQ